MCERGGRGVGGGRRTKLKTIAERKKKKKKNRKKKRYAIQFSCFIGNRYSPHASPGNICLTRKGVCVCVCVFFFLFSRFSFFTRNRWWARRTYAHLTLVPHAVRNSSKSHNKPIRFSFSHADVYFWNCPGKRLATRLMRYIEALSGKVRKESEPELWGVTGALRNGRKNHLAKFKIYFSAKKTPTSHVLRGILDRWLFFKRSVQKMILIPTSPLQKWSNAL